MFYGASPSAKQWVATLEKAEYSQQDAEVKHLALIWANGLPRFQLKRISQRIHQWRLKIGQRFTVFLKRNP